MSMRDADLAATLDAKSAAANGAKPDTPTVSIDASGKLTLPPVPAVGDHHALAQWLTVSFGLDPAHPITRAERQGLAGPQGHVELFRAGAQSIRLEPVKVVNQPPRLIETVSGWATHTDGPIHALKADHCRLIAHVVRMLCGHGEAITARQEAEGIVGMLQQSAEAIEGLTTRGTSSERYEAADALGGDPADRYHAPRYLIDRNTGELVIRAGDLGDVARRYVGGSVARGWLDARLRAIGWERATLDGHAIEGRSGRTGPHARCVIYRGLLPHAEDATT